MISNMQRNHPAGWSTDLVDRAPGGARGGAMYFHQHPEQLPDWAAKSCLGRELQRLPPRIHAALKNPCGSAAVRVLADRNPAGVPLLSEYL